MRAAWASALGSWTARALLAAAIATGCVHVFAATADSPASLDAPRTVVAAKSLNILGVRFGGDDNQTRVVVDIDAAMSTKVLTAQSDPRQIVFALPRVATAVASDGAGHGLIKTWRVVRDSQGDRLVLDLTQQGQIAHRFLLAPTRGSVGYRYVIDVARLAVATPVPEAVAAQNPVALAVSPTLIQASTPALVSGRTLTVSASTRPRIAETTPAPARRLRKVVVIDPGHGGHDPGAQSTDANEKDITLAAARALKTRLERDGRYKVVMTRDSDVFIPLEDRVRIARRAGADLFISLHADSAGADPDTHGASVYTLSDHGETRVTQVLGPHEWFTHNGDHAADPAVGQILLDLTQRSTLNRSAVFAGLLIDRLGDTIDLLPRSHRDASYFVLLAPDVPAVLVEMGFISSPLDEARLADPSQRCKLMDAVAGAIDAYFTGQTRLAAR